MWGALWGSFFQLFVTRWPHDLPVVVGRSQCPHCKTALAWWQLVPILSYLALGGRANCCGKRIAFQYVLVEVATGLLAVAVSARTLMKPELVSFGYNPSVVFLLEFFFVAGLLIVALIDFQWMLIPDEVTLLGTALALVFCEAHPGVDAANAALGAGVGFLLIQVPFVWLYELLTGKRGMGEGDSKLLMMIGAFFGWRSALEVLFLATAQGSVITLATRVLGVKFARPLDEFEERHDPMGPGGPEGNVGPLRIPFGPFLVLAAGELLFFRSAIGSLF